MHEGLSRPPTHTYRRSASSTLSTMAAAATPFRGGVGGRGWDTTLDSGSPDHPGRLQPSRSNSMALGRSRCLLKFLRDRTTKKLARLWSRVARQHCRSEVEQQHRWRWLPMMTIRPTSSSSASEMLEHWDLIFHSATAMPEMSLFLLQATPLANGPR